MRAGILLHRDECCQWWPVGVYSVKLLVLRPPMCRFHLPLCWLKICLAQSQRVNNSYLVFSSLYPWKSFFRGADGSCWLEITNRKTGRLAGLDPAPRRRTVSMFACRCLQRPAPCLASSNVQIPSPTLLEKACLGTIAEGQQK